MCQHREVILNRKETRCLPLVRPGPVLCLLLRVSSDYAQPIIGQVTEITCPVIGQAQPELTLSKRQKTGPGLHYQTECPLTNQLSYQGLTHWGRVTHICIGKQTIIGSDDGLSPGRRQAIIWTNDGILLIGPLETNFSEISIKILTFSFTKMRLKVSAKWRPFCLGLKNLRPRPQKLEHDSPSLWCVSIQRTWCHCQNWVTPGSGDIHICIFLNFDCAPAQKSDLKSKVVQTYVNNPSLQRPLPVHAVW